MVEVQISRAGNTANLSAEEENEAVRVAQQILQGGSAPTSELSREQVLRARFLASDQAQRTRAIQETGVRARERLIAQRVGAESLGGFTTAEGERVLVDPSGRTQVRRVGGAEPQLIVSRTTQQPIIQQSLLETGGTGFTSASNIHREQMIDDVSDRDVGIFTQTGNLLFGERGERFVGIGGVPVALARGKALVTLRDVRTTAEKRGGFIGRAFGPSIPTTPGGVALDVGLVAGLGVAPKLIRTGVLGGFTTLQTKRALDPTLTKEQRFAAGTFGVLAGAGTTFEATPFIRGGIAQTVGRASGKFKPVKTQPEGFKAIEGIADSQRIGLILEKSPLRTGKTAGVSLPSTSPIVRGGFGVTSSQKSQFLGGPQTVATSQIGFFRRGKDTLLDREFFVTPQEPTLKIPETRISRLGLSNLLSFTPRARIGFGIPKSAQIGIESGAFVSRTGKRGSFSIGKGTELEAIKGAGAIITDVKPLGVTTIRGQGVDIFEFKTTPSLKLSTDKLSTTSLTERVSGESLISASLSTQTLTKEASTVTTPTLTTTGTSSLSLPKTTSISLPTTKITSPVTRTISRPSSLTVSPPRSSSISPPRTPPVSPSVSLPISPPKLPTLTPSLPTTSRRPTLPKLPRLPRSRSVFGVSVRRRGVFRPIGRFTSLEKALATGRGRVGRSLAATFRVTGPRISGTPAGFRRRVTPRGTLFIERRRFRLSTRPEVREIGTARRRKKKRKK